MAKIQDISETKIYKLQMFYSLLLGISSDDIKKTFTCLNKVKFKNWKASINF